MSGTRHIVILGDSTVDWHVLQLPATGAMALCEEAGGAARTAALLRSVVEVQSTPKVSIVLASAGPAARRVISWSRDKQSTWRPSSTLVESRVPALTASTLAEPAGVLVIDDSDATANAIDMRAAIGSDTTIVFIVGDATLTSGAWHQVHEHHADRTIAIIPIDVLCGAEVHISRNLSWERTAQDTMWELMNNPRVNGLARCADVVVSFGTNGAFWLRHDNGELFFDAVNLEEPVRRGSRLPGESACLTASFAAAAARSPHEPDIRRAIQAGIAAQRELHAHGFDADFASDPPRFAFPHARIARILADSSRTVASCAVRDPVKNQDGEGQPAWSILTDRLTAGYGEIAARIAVEGLDRVIDDVPVARFGQLVTFDRGEIESYRSIRALMAEYCGRPQKKPLSLAVFGPPGSGKSFGVTELAASLSGGQTKVLEFNLSQFDDPADLRSALHQVRDAVLSGFIPLVFWDEFDTALKDQPLGWLRHFLAPMQDGRFAEGQLVHPIGRSIFIFAGGTAARIADFGASRDPAEFRAVKGPDFVSRLRGSIDILGPNPQPRGTAADPFFVVRRGLLLRNIVRRHAPQLFEGDRMHIDRGLLRAFLETHEYRHGARSMEAVVTMSTLGGLTTYERSALPGEQQLNLHVDGRDFLARAHHTDLDDGTVERLARAHHDVYRSEMRTLHAYDELPEDEKVQNREAVRDIAAKLAIAGYRIMPARSNDSSFTFPTPEVEVLAEHEHDRWARLKIANGWRHGPATSKPDKRHASLLLWSSESARRWAPTELQALGPGELPDEEKEKDRTFVRHLPEILRRAGFTAMKDDRA